ncbi:hypothetical protein NQ318_001789 [Aromia moschata]|uniref:Acyltransferase 3 domain-containing protein n=1 Tax=Aromia moschata TaxID=1265417 RepID=A0AAV8XI91_9CUCU|nr:hypothetical protein NQ318_001789 [Aromia moschata]
MLETGKRVNLKYMIFAFINRYIRLTPTVAVMIAFESTWLVHMGKGPQWEDFVVREYKNCRQSWWTNLLYINNYVYKKEMCLHQTWYIAADTQLFALSLIILTVAGKNPSRAKAIFASGIILGLIVQGGVAFFRNYDIIIRQYPDLILWGIPKIHHILWWLLSFGMCIFIILIAAKMYAPSYHSSRLESALYWSFGKNIFALGIAVGIFGITQKIGWFARWVCEWQAIQILGRITFSTYIIHTALIRMRAGYMRSPLFLNDFILLTTTVGDVALSYLGGTVLCLCFEMPISALQKLMVFDMDTKVKKEVTEKDMKTMDFKKNTSGKEQILCTNV